MPRSIQPAKRLKHRGQNLVELVFTLPLVLIMIFLTIELGRVWYAYNSAKMAAEKGVYTAAIYHNASSGQVELEGRLAAANLDVVTAQVAQVPNKHAYRADVTVTFTPFLANLVMPTVAGDMRIFPAAFDISYEALNDASVY